MLTIKTINKELASRGHEERLCFCKELGYFYFAEGKSAGWFRSMVGGVYRVNQLTLDQWMQEYNELAKD